MVYNCKHMVYKYNSVHSPNIKVQSYPSKMISTHYETFSMCASAVFAEFFSGKIIHGLSVTASRLLRDKSKIER